MKSKMAAMRMMVCVVIMIFGFYFSFARGDIPTEVSLFIVMVGAIMTGYWIDEWRQNE